jgi:GlcNAc-P-P-Und epimerase
MKILITGSSGLIGRWVASRLSSDGHVVVGLDVLDPPEGFGKVDQFLRCNILDRAELIDKVQKSAPDVLIHLAARVDLDETTNLSGYAANIDGVRNMIDSIRATPSIKREIYTSSQLVCRVGYVPTSDTDYCPSTLYGESKVRTEQIVREQSGGGVEWCLVRPTTVWGPHMSPHYQKLLKLIKRQLYFHSGSAPLYKSYAYAGNIAYQYRQLVSAPVASMLGKTFVLCDYEPLSLRRYADALAQALGARKIPTLPIPVARLLARAGDVLNAAGASKFPFNSFRLNNILTEYVFNTDEIESVCGPLPCSFEEGVHATAQWFSKQEGVRASER